MKNGRMFILLTAVIMLTGFDDKDYEENVQEHLDRLQEKSSELEKAQDMKAHLSFVKESSQVDWDIDYFEYNELKKQAEQLNEKSNGRFNVHWGIYLIYQAKQKGIDPNIVFELLNVETGGKFDPSLVGPPTKYGQAYGLAQFMKNTGPWIAEKSDLPYSHTMLFDPYYSIQLSIEYLDYLQDKFGNWDKTLTAYHRGVGGLEDYEEKHGDAKSWYAVEIQQKAQQ
ncbi:Transglycosylase SLT domain-containing protein [Alteribacillus persepolensis]|uniref:Transglycosylase SLT domain-containing protein n=1 Tax=Alteribacillus persepolensis TaxID=568899 RepID=A0A1G8CTA2_9BACI|nr:transglycosylase SLT domain-containing protein [Alteribacillus persepolensis]SDH48701.1 Transglycosylase SLT domain-containing protein [Alteribacillus persepolensis]